MRVKALRRVHVLRQTREQKLTQVEAGTVRGLTTRHIRRLLKQMVPAGDQGLAHRGRGTSANRRLPDEVTVMRRTLYAQREGDFGPTAAARQSARRGPAGPGRGSASAEVGGL